MNNSLLFGKHKICLKFLKSYCSSTTLKWSKPTGTVTKFRIYQTVAKEKVPFIMKSDDCITWYACGPTVYDSAHLGHASTYMRFDIIKRILKTLLNKPIIQVMCITNIDDKIIARSNETGLDWRVLSASYERDFFADFSSLNIIKPSMVARATDYIPQMIKFIEKLVQKELAYRSQDGSVYFDLQKYGRGGKFREIDLNSSNQEKLCEYKKCPADFALWKAAKPKEPFWESPWGPGRPGWHIECSVIASEYFGDSIDIHSGGMDLIFPHHENEETQCCAFHGIDQWVNYWIHSGHLYLANDSEKMSKSLKNTISIEEFLSSYSANHFRMMCFMMDYRTNIVYSDELMADSIKFYNKFINFFDTCSAYVNGYTKKGDVDGPRLLQILAETKLKVTEALQDDFNTEFCMWHLLHLVNETNSMLFPDSGKRCPISISLVCDYLRDTLTQFGFTFDQTAQTDGSKLNYKLDKVIDSSVSFRDNVRKTTLASKKNEVDFQNGCSTLLKLCDDFREEFRCQGIVIKDHKTNKSTWMYSDTEKTE